MAITVRNYSNSGSNKAATNTFTLAAGAGSEIPRAGDLFVVGWVADNLSASTPTCASVANSSRLDSANGVFGSLTDASATAAADIIVGYAYMLVTADFVAVTDFITVNLSAAVTAKAAVAMVLTGGSTLADYAVDVRIAPTHTIQGSLNLAHDSSVFVRFGAAQSSSTPTLPAGTPVASAGTSGGSGATNVASRMAYAVGNTGSTGPQIGSIVAEWGLEFYSGGAAPQIKTPADTAAGADSLTEVDNRLRTPADLAGGVDVLTDVWQTGAQSRVENPADTAGGSDSLAGAYDRPKAPADTAAGSDSLSGAYSRVQSPADAAAGSDALSTLAAQDRQPADTAAGTDSATDVWQVGGQQVKTPADTAAGSDLANVVALRPRQVDDTAAGSDALTDARDQIESAADTAAGADSVNVDRATGRAEGLADLAIGSDATILAYDRSRTAADTAAGSDALGDAQDYARAPADTAAGSDSATSLRGQDKSPADIANGSDSLTVVWVRARAVSDLAAGSDNCVDFHVGTRTKTVADTAAGRDSVTVQRIHQTALGAGTARTLYGVDLRVQLGIARSAEAGAWDTGAWDTQVWAQTDTALGDWLDVACDVASPFILGAGADDSDGVVTRWEAATCAFTLHGSTWDPWNGPYTDLIGPGVAVRVLWRKTQAADTDPWLAAFTGAVSADGWKWNPDQYRPNAEVSATDGTQVLAANDPVEQSPQGSGETASQRVSRILDLASWPTNLRDITSGGVALKSTTLANPAWEQLLQVADTDLALMWLRRDGRVAYRPQGRVGVGTELAARLVVCDPGPNEVQVVTLGGAEFTEIRNSVAISRQKEEGVAEEPATYTATDDGSIARYLKHAYKRTDLLHQNDNWSSQVALAILAASAWPTHAPRSADLNSRLSPVDAPALLLSLEPSQVFDVVDDTGRLWRQQCVGWRVSVGYSEMSGSIVLDDVGKWVGGQWDSAIWNQDAWSFQVTVPGTLEHEEAAA